MRPFVCTIAFCLILIFPNTINAADIYVSPSGNDNNPGSFVAPVRTPSRARDLARSLADPGRGITIELAGGNYFLPEPLILDSRDSGHGAYNIIWQGAAGAKAVISGGTPITFQSGSDGLWVADVQGQSSRDLWVNGVPTQRAKTTTGLSTMTYTQTGYSNVPPALISQIAASDNVEVVNHVAWTEFRCPIISASGTSITLSQPCWYHVRLDHHGTPGIPVAIEHAKAFIDEPGEWYLEKSGSKQNNKLYYKPRTGETFGSQAILGRLEALIIGNGTESSPLKNIEFRNLTFAHSTWNEPTTTGWVTNQAHIGFPTTSKVPDLRASTLMPIVSIPSAIRFSFADNIRFTNSIITRIGSNGLEYGRGVHSSSLDRNSFTHIGGSAIVIAPLDEPKTTNDRRITRHISVTNNSIGPTGLDYLSAAGIFVGYGQNITIDHNNLGSMPYTGISNGWGWGSQDPTIAKDNKITNNRISDVVLTLADGGGIYSLSYQPGLIISGNLIQGDHSNYTSGPNDGVFLPIYLDQWSSGVTISGNVVFSNAPYSINHTGGNNTITGNYINHGITIQPMHSCYPSPCKDSTITNNTTISSLDQVPANIITTAGVIPITSIPGDLNSDGHVNLYDYNILVAGFGTKYTIYDYNNLVANYGK